MSRSVILAVLAAVVCGSPLHAQSLPFPLDRERSRALFIPLRAMERSLAQLEPLTPGDLPEYVQQLARMIEDTGFFDRVRDWLRTSGPTPGLRRLLRTRADSLRLELGAARSRYEVSRAFGDQPVDADDRRIGEALARALTQAALYDSLANFLPPPRLRRILWPVRLGSTPEARCFWRHRGAQVLSGVGVGIWKDRAAVAVEMYQDYYGGVRASFGTALSATSDQDASAANVQRFFAAGGNGSLGLAYPVLSYSSLPVECDPAVPAPEGVTAVTAQMIFSPRIGVDVPKVGAAVTKWTGNLDLGVDLRVSLSGAERTIAFFAQARPALVLGTDAFYGGVGRTPAKPFAYVLWTLGLVFKGEYGLTFTMATAPAALQDQMQGVVSVAVRP